MTPRPVTPKYHAAILRNNARFVHWLSPLDAAELETLLSKATYARQLMEGEAVLIGYDVHGPYRHKNVDWLAQRLDSAFYIDRIIIGEVAQWQGLGRILYSDIAHHARANGFQNLACEVNTVPDNPASHAFHRKLGFLPTGDERCEGGKAVRYYANPLTG